MWYYDIANPSAGERTQKGYNYEKSFKFNSRYGYVSVCFHSLWR